MASSKNPVLHHIRLSGQSTMISRNCRRPPARYLAICEDGVPHFLSSPTKYREWRDIRHARMFYLLSKSQLVSGYVFFCVFLRPDSARRDLTTEHASHMGTSSVKIVSHTL